MENRKPLELWFDFDGRPRTGVNCPREHRWKQLEECLACRYNSGTVAWVHGLAVVCRYDPGPVFGIPAEERS